MMIAMMMVMTLVGGGHTGNDDYGAVMAMTG